MRLTPIGYVFLFVLIGIGIVLAVIASTFQIAWMAYALFAYVIASTFWFVDALGYFD